MLTREFVEKLLCPSCQQGNLVPDCTVDGEALLEGRLGCPLCDAEFDVRSGIPHLKPLAQQDDEVWSTWRDHLKGFEARRHQRTSAPSEVRDGRWAKKLQAFASFVDAPAGNMLDVGCGPGKLRKTLDADRVIYHGLDPIPVEDVRAFPFVCGVAEFLPFQSGMFTSIVVRSALDHFCDLNAFFQEASRVLVDDGRIYLEQVIHGSNGMSGLIKNAVHATKDLIDDVKTLHERNSAPKHMREFSQGTLMDSIDGVFAVERVETYTSNWYTPTQLFVCLSKQMSPVAAG